MKKLFFLIVCIAFSLEAKSQIPFAPLGAKWYTLIYGECYGGANNADVYITHEVLSDTIIQGKYCTIIKDIDGPQCANDFYVHQDSDKVYILDEVSGDFQLLYDFGAQVGATWKIKVCDWFYLTDSMTITIKEVQTDFQIIDMFPSNNTFSWVFENHKVFKGIGGELDNPLLFHDIEFAVPGCQTQLLCYYTPSTGIINIGGPCEPNAINEPNIKEKIGIQIYPNPASTQFSIVPNQPISRPNEFFLFDATGKNIKNYKIAPGQPVQTFQLDNLPDGLYFWKLKNEQNLIGSGKLIIIQ